MNTTGLMVKLGLAGLLLSALASEARADLIGLTGRLDASTSVSALVYGYGVSRETPFGVDLDLEPYYWVQQSSFGHSDYASNTDSILDYDLASSRSEWGAALASSQNGYELNTSMYSEAAAQPYIAYSRSETITSATISMVFDRDTEVDVLLRIDYARGGLGNSGPGFVSGGFAVEGLVDAPGSEFLLEGPLEDEGFVEFSFRATAQAGEAFTLTADGLAEFWTISNGRWDGWGSLEMTASVQVVPAPGGVLVLGGLGLVAGRRRR